jgi:Raf kinase inhibitor-like YbhB/YbcL family protein
MNLRVTSPMFEKNGLIPMRYTCDGKDVNPPVTITNIPKSTKSLVLIVDDPDAPMGTWDHWVVWNIAPTQIIEENSVPGTEGVNSFRKHSYGGPSPPSGTHRYFFRVYALDTNLDLHSNSRKKDVKRAMKGHILAQGEVIGLYKRRR